MQKLYLDSIRVDSGKVKLIKMMIKHRLTVCLPWTFGNCDRIVYFDLWPKRRKQNTKQTSLFK